MGDSTFWDRLHDLAGGSRPLVRIDAATTNRSMLDSSITITDDGRRALAGEIDWTSVASYRG